MQNRRPHIYPSYELEVVESVSWRRRAIADENIVNGLVEDGDWAGHSRNQKRLTGKQRGCSRGDELQDVS